MSSRAIEQDRFSRLRCCVLLPTYNNSATIGDVVKQVLDYTSHVLVVNDGSTDNTLEILSAWPELKIFSYAQNVGKGWALRKGFEFALANGYDYAITMDTDGQHFASDLPAMLNMLEQHKDAIIIGARNMEQNGVPGRSSFGNKFSNFWFELETGIKMPDTQSGYRLYPLKQLGRIRFFTRKFEFEIEVIVRGAWSGLKVLPVPVKIYYAPAETRVSHFRPFQDFSRISVINTVFVILTFIWIKPRNFFASFKKKGFKAILNEHLIRSHETPQVKAASVGLGVFWGLTPFWGFQMWFVLFFAWVFKLNKALSILASNISIPPMIPLIIFSSYWLGAVWINNAIHLNYSSNLTLEVIQKNLLQYVLGSFTLAFFCAIAAWLSTFIFVTKLKRQKA